MVVYLVTSGEYSDYRVNGVFSSREDAQAVADQLPESNPVDEWAVDELVGFVMRPAWLAHIDLDLGEVESIGRSPFRILAHPRETYRERYGQVMRPGTSDYRKCSLTVTSFVSAEHARQVAIERRREFMEAAGTGSALLVDRAGQYFIDKA